MRSANPAAIGLDVGGTDIKGGVVAADGSIRVSRTIATDADRGPKHVIERIIELCQELHGAAAGSEVVGVGLGMPGSIRVVEGLAVAPPNLPGWDEVSVAAPLSRALGLPVRLENDANAAALGEHWRGAGRGARHLVLLTLGTGIGGGIILDGDLHRGCRENAGEVGHMIVEPGGRACPCGQLGCLERYASASSTAARAEEALASGEASALRDVHARGVAITAEDVVGAAQAGDGLAQRIWDETCRYLAVACVNLQHLFNFERIIFAGGMSAAGTTLVGPVREHFKRMMWPDRGDHPEILAAELGSRAGMLGAASLLLRSGATTKGSA